MGQAPRHRIAADSDRLIRTAPKPHNTQSSRTWNRTPVALLLIGLLLEVVQKDGEGAGLLAEVGDDGAGSADGLLDVALLVELGEAAPGTKVLAGVDHDDGHLSLGAEGTDKLLVLLVLAVLGEAAEAGGTAVQGLGALVQSLLEAVMDEGLLEDLLEGIKNGHLDLLFLLLDGLDLGVVLFFGHGWIG